MQILKKKSIIWAMTLVMAATCIAMPASVSAAESEDENAQEVTKTAAPKTVKATVAANYKQAYVAWSNVSGADTYYVYNGSKKVSTVKKGTSAFKKRTVKVTGLSKGKTYTLGVVAKDNDKDKASSKKTKKYTSPKKLTTSTSGYKNTNAYKVMQIAKSKKGSAYVSGAAGPNSFDCSGYVHWVYKAARKAGSKGYKKYKSYKVSTKSFSRSSCSGMYSALKKYRVKNNKGKYTTNTSYAQPGDIILFGKSGGSSASHAALYYGNGKIIHASSGSTGVIVTSVGYSCYNKHVVAIIRLPNM